MADKQIIAATLSLETGNAPGELKEFNKGVSNVKENLKDTGATALKTGKDVDTSTGSFKNLKGQMSALPGPLGQAGEGVNKLSSAFKALLANPVVLVIAAIVAGLALLYKAFTNTFEGGQKVEQVFAGIKAAAQALLDNLSKVGNAIVKVFSFDFSGAIDEIKGVAQAASDAYNKMADLTKEAQNLAREQATNDLDQAKRARDLAILREQASEESDPAKRKAALLELKKVSEQNAKDDIDLAKRTADNKIAQLTLEKDGEKKNFAEIQKIKAEQINSETQNANELRRINKQITAAEKQEQSERSEAAKAAAAAAKEQRAKLLEANNTLRKIQQNNELLSIKDGYEKELKQLEIKVAEEKRVNQQAFNDGKLNKAQYDAIQLELDKQANLERSNLTDKHNKELADKETAFQKELTTISTKTRLDGIRDARELEKVQLQIGYEEKLQDAALRYKDDAIRFQAIKTALDEQLKADQLKIDEKNKLEDAKKKLDLDLKAQQDIIDKQDFDFKAKIAAVDAEQALVQKAFDDKTITEEIFNSKIAGFADARKKIRTEEQAHTQETVAATSTTLGNLSNLVGKQTLLGKTFAIAQTAIDTYSSAIAAYKSMSSIPVVGPALGAIAAAAAVKNGLDAVKKIVAVQIPGGGGGGGNVPTAPSITAPAAPIAPTQSSTIISNTDDLNNAARNPVPAFVIDSQGAGVRERNERLRRASVLGG